ncbi:hypothetical protein M0M57_06350 [Flavobacterium azooxidireducens]|jgi:hypothetical protein|uniref:Toxin-antitoxin system, antitoxin component, ribbon-helix-helix domain protein n=1 Tax=Flavobacterium azooxidireducens TaxID=1871076 RepID=A0ABY4KM17_9FLAO|nr:DUF2683 family protein [Flavobacterium azooxidireducens]UPQ80455.1 hypothetical protein M0M57_06350 [Flavobacterium azooxidireducens]
MTPLNITIHPQDDAQIEAVKAFMKALKIKFEISKDKPFSLTGEQQKQLDDQVGLDKKHYTDAETVYGDLKNKYGL